VNAGAESPAGDSHRPELDLGAWTCSSILFGVPPSTNAGIARIGLRADAPIVPGFIARQGAAHATSCTCCPSPARGFRRPLIFEI
jgi:hypothetical protein